MQVLKKERQNIFKRRALLLKKENLKNKIYRILSETIFMEPDKRVLSFKNLTYNPKTKKALFFYQIVMILL